MKKIREMGPQLDSDMTSEPRVVSDGSPSQLEKLYETDEFRLAWENSVKFQLSRQLLYLRRFRDWSQARVAREMGSSQSAVARIESGEENVTADTLERHIKALKGRFSVSIAPQEMPLPRWKPWWEVAAESGTSSSTTDWRVLFLAWRSDGATERVAAVLGRSTLPSDGQLLLTTNVR
jgi:transcriptional regulator with XRE-family HTH domain